MGEHGIIPGGLLGVGHSVIPGGLLGAGHSVIPGGLLGGGHCIISGRGTASSWGEMGTQYWGWMLLGGKKGRFCPQRSPWAGVGTELVTMARWGQHSPMATLA